MIAVARPTTTARDFLTALLPEPEDGECIEVRCFDSAGTPRRGFFPTVAGAIDFAREHRQAWDVYVGVGLRKPDEGGAIAGDVAHTSRLLALYADLDLKCFDDGEAGARRALARFPLPPSIVVHTGHGLHLYWLLREPYDTGDAPLVR